MTIGIKLEWLLEAAPQFESHPLQAVLNAVAMIAGAGDYRTAAAIGGIIGVIIIMLRAVIQFDGRGIRYQDLFIAYVLWLMLYAPSVRVSIEDTYTGSVVVVDNVPMGRRVVGSVMSNMGYRTTKKAYVVDDSVKQRFGKKMPGISSHFDHTSVRHMMGQQVLTLGLSCEEGFVPLDSELFISQTKAIKLPEPFEDGRSIAAKRYRTAQQWSKPEMAGAMVKRALNAGIMADYLLADAWFGTKGMIRLSQETALVPVLRMKKNNMKYRLSEFVCGGTAGRELDVEVLYKHAVRKAWQPIRGQKYQAKMVDVELNLAESKDLEEWVKVRLLFVRGNAGDTQTTAGKHDWAVFLTTDMSLSAAEILGLYSLRWAIEVYFKEAKQHLGFLKEQSNHYAAYIASIHLTAIRFCLLVIAKQTQGAASFALMRQKLCCNSTDISFASKLWQVFRVVITGALDELRAVLGDAATWVMETIDAHIQCIQCLFTQALQLDPRTLRLEAL